MREILFRAWDKVRREYLSGGEVFIAIQRGKNPKNTFYLDILKDPDLYKDRFELEQFTGLTDKNGKKIPSNIRDMVAFSEFNRYYARAVLVRAIDENKSVTIPQGQIALKFLSNSTTPKRSGSET